MLDQFKQPKEHKQLKHADKAQHYLDLLDTARCNGQWQETQELTRKVAKHAPHRQCFILAAQIERTSGQHDFSRLMTAPTSKGLSRSISSLLKAIEKERASENTFKEDVYQAQTCLAWLYATNKEYSLAVSALPPDLDKIIDNLDLDAVGVFSMSWTHVCIIKGAYIKGISLEQDGKPEEAPRVFKAMLPYVASLPSKYADTLGHRCWTEQLLTSHCLIWSRGLLYRTKNHRDQRSLHRIPFFPGAKTLLAPFRQYAQTWRTIKLACPGLNINKDSSTRTWKAYYDSLSSFLQQGIVRPIFKSKSDQRIELEGVQADYEAILHKEVQFPRADQTNLQMEDWIDQVMANWHVLSSRSWHEDDLGQGGRDRLNKNVLDILYRASQKTFESTRVTRHLFVVYSAMAKFSIASKALDSYFEIWGRGEVRSVVSGKPEAALDNLDTALRTGAAGILMLCNYGHRKEAKKALEMAEIMEKYLSDPPSTTLSAPVVSADDVLKEPTARTRKVKSLISKEAMALSYHALGVAQARWSRLTYENSRSELLEKAIVNFRLVVEPQYGEHHNPELLLSYALALASSRNIVVAIVYVKEALSKDSKHRRKHGISSRDFAPENIDEDDDTNLEGRIISLRCWHLLALLLSSRGEYTSAVASCEAAFDLYGDKSILYGDLTPLHSITGLSFADKNSMIELKITQLAIVEASDGLTAAVATSGELLGLYKRLFNYDEKLAPAVQQVSHPPPPTANGTLRSVRGSILGLPLASGLKAKLSSPSNRTSSRSLASDEEPTRPPTPKPSSTSDQDSVIFNRHPAPTLPPPQRLKFRPRQDELKKAPHPETAQYDSEEVGVAISYDMPSGHSSPVSPSSPINKIPLKAKKLNHRKANTNPIPPKLSPTQLRSWATEISPTITVPAFQQPPEPHFSERDADRHALTLLIKIWCSISAVYQRASMPLDAQGALTEAVKHGKVIEADITEFEGSAAKYFAEVPWANPKSHDELQADVLDEQAQLHYLNGEFELAGGTYEQAINIFPNHVGATVNLCRMSLEEWAEPTPSRIRLNPNKDNPPNSPPSLAPQPLPQLSTAPLLNEPLKPTDPHTDEPEELFCRLAARDRAFGLLSMLVKTAAGSDSPEAWDVIGKAYEASGMEEKARQAYWWVVTLMQGRGVRAFSNVV